MNLRSFYSDTNTKCPPNISPPEYKPPKKYIRDFTGFSFDEMLKLA